MFSTNNTLTSSTAYAKNEILAKQVIQQSKENFDIDMFALVLPKAVKGIVIDTITLTLVETLLSTISRSCANCCSFIKELLSFCCYTIEELLSSCRCSINKLSFYCSFINKLSSF
jgi:hypothetical protein